VVAFAVGFLASGRGGETIASHVEDAGVFECELDAERMARARGGKAIEILIYPTHVRIVRSDVIQFPMQRAK